MTFDRSPLERSSIDASVSGANAGSDGNAEASARLSRSLHTYASVFQPVANTATSNEQKDAGDLIALAGKSAVNAGLLNPINGVGQLANKGLDAANVKTHIPEVPTFHTLDQPAKTFSGEWFADNIGAGVGAVLPFMLARGGVGAVAKSMEATAIGRVASTVPLAGRMGSSLAGGAIFGGVFTPVADDSNFWQNRLQNSAISSATFGTQHGATMLAMGGLSKAGLQITEASLLNSLGGQATRVGLNAFGGSVAGTAHAELTAKLHNGRWATSDEIFSSVAAFTVTGAVMDGAQIAMVPKALRGSTQDHANDARSTRKLALPPDQLGKDAVLGRDGDGHSEKSGGKMDVQARLTEGAEAARGIRPNSKGVIRSSEIVKGTLDATIEQVFKGKDPAYSAGHQADFTRLISEVRIREHDGAGLDGVEVSKTLNAVDRLLKADKLVVDITPEQRLALAKQMLFEVANPAETHHGNNNAAPVQAITQMLLDRHPGKTAEAVVDVLTTGKHTTVGTKPFTVDLSAETLSKLPEAYRSTLAPDAEAHSSLTAAGEPGVRPNQRQGRSYFQQLAQTLGANVETQFAPEGSSIYVKGQIQNGSQRDVSEQMSGALRDGGGSDRSGGSQRDGNSNRSGGPLHDTGERVFQRQADGSFKELPGSGAIDPFLQTTRLLNIYDRMTGTDNASLVLKNGKYFLITNTEGMVTEGGITSKFGLYGDDTRFMNSYEVRVNGRQPSFISADMEGGYSGKINYAIRNSADGKDLPAGAVTMTRDLVLVNEGVAEKITVKNNSTDAQSVNVSLGFGSDFRDMFEVRGWERSNRGTMEPAAVSQENGTVSLSYTGADQSRITTDITLGGTKPKDVTAGNANYKLDLPAGAERTIEVSIAPATNKADGARVVLPYEATFQRAERDYQNWRQSLATVETDNPSFNAMMERSYRDFYMLRLPIGKGEAVAAGIPWFVSPFGRDQAVAALQSQGFMPQKSKNVLKHLAEYQGTVEDAVTAQKPGKIMHELRVGEMARNGEIPFAPYYGTADATPLWVSLLGKTVRWTGDKQLANDLRPNLENALKFIDGEVEKTGYLTYGGTGKEALANQGWKDSGDSIMHKDGKLVQGPIALAEIQGYLYSAWREAGNLYEMWGDKVKADHYNKRADALKERFNRDFWSPEDNFLALGLDGQGQRAEVISSNPGHVLSTGLLTPEHAFAVESRLMQPDMFNGYGLKTLAEGQPRHHSGSYHDGSIWPHDNGMIGEGVHDLVPGSGHTSKLIDGLFDASKHYPNNRLPELFAGYRRNEYGRPIPYPVSSIPQAWAAGSMMQLVRSNLGLHGNALTNELLVFKPSLPNSYKSLSLSGLWVGDNRVDLMFRRSGPRVLTEVVNNPGNVKVNVVEPQAGS